MRKENSVLTAYEAPIGRITRARVAASGATGVVLPLKPPLANPEKKVQRGKKRRDENSYAAPTAAFQNKRRGVLRDVTNTRCENSFKGCVNVTKIQTRVSQKIKSAPSKAKLCSGKKISDVAPAIPVENTSIFENRKEDRTQDVVMLETQDADLSFIVKENYTYPEKFESLLDGESTCDTTLIDEETSKEGPKIICHINDG